MQRLGCRSSFVVSTSGWIGYGGRTESVDRRAHAGLRKRNSCRLVVAGERDFTRPVRGNDWKSEFHEGFGRVFLMMKDVLDAGRHLFVSGGRATAYSAAIELLLERHARKGEMPFLARLPADVRRCDFERFSETLMGDVARFGLDTADSASQVKRKRSKTPLNN